MNDTPRRTRVNAPDLDWSQVRETVLMLELSAGQIEGAMKAIANGLFSVFACMGVPPIIKYAGSTAQCHACSILAS